LVIFIFLFQAEDGIRDRNVTGVQTCALPILVGGLIMDYLIVSDTHGDRQILADIIAHYKGHVRAMFYNGDSELQRSDELFDTLQIGRASCRERLCVLEMSVA